MSLKTMPGLGKSGTLRMSARTYASVSTLVAGTTTRSGAGSGRADTPRGVGAARAGTRFRDDFAAEPFAFAIAWKEGSRGLGVRETVKRLRRYRSRHALRQNGAFGRG